jgi:hypothetical protein
MKVETCGECGCRFSWDNTALFGGSPATQWLSYICPDCAREKAAQARHAEQERETERRHQERMASDNLRQQESVKSSNRDVEWDEIQKEASRDLRSQWCNSPLGNLYYEFERKKKLSASVDDLALFYWASRERLAALPLNEQLEIFIRKNHEIVDFNKRNIKHHGKPEIQALVYINLFMAPIFLLILKAMTALDIPSPFWAVIPLVGPLMGIGTLILALLAGSFLPSLVSIVISTGIWFYLRYRKMGPLIEFDRLPNKDYSKDDSHIAKPIDTRIEGISSVIHRGSHETEAAQSTKVLAAISDNFQRENSIEPISSTIRNGKWRVIILSTIVLFLLWIFVSYFDNGKFRDRLTSVVTRAIQPNTATVAKSIGVKAASTNSLELVKKVVSSNSESIANVLSAAEYGTNLQIESAARDAGRASSFAEGITRDRKRSRSLNEAALKSLKSQGDPQESFGLQQQAFEADPLDSEVAGNLAIFALRANQDEQARAMSIYALSLPRQTGKTGRTADWATLAASYAVLGDQQKAREALYVTLAIAADVSKRCSSAVYSVRNTYTAALKEATEAMFERIKERSLSSSQECALPISW